jgi:phosphonoacetate hydrolase
MTDPDRVATVVDALLDPSLEPIVDMVANRAAEGGGYEVRTVDGRVRFRRADGGSGNDGSAYVETLVEGRNPLGDTATDRFVPLADERANLWPTRASQSYPHAHEHIAQVFDHPAAPEIVCLHTPAHNWED